MRNGSRIVALLGALALLVGLQAPAVPRTDAAFGDGEYAAATLTATAVPAPQSLAPGCVLTTGLAGANPEVTITWRIPADATGYSSADAEYGWIVGGILTPITGALLGSIHTTGTPSAYTTVVSAGLLGGVLGGSVKFGIRLKGPGSWTSGWIVATASAGVAGINPTCSMSTAPSP